MKRTITCPKCETKLSVFDLGKPISQKCPKCGNNFTVESEEKKDAAKDSASEPEKKDAGVAAPTASEEKKASADAAAKPDAVPAKEADKKSAAPTAKPSAPVKREPSYTASAEPEPAAGGQSLMFPVIVIGLLILLAVMQVMTKMRAEKQYGTLIKHLQFVEETLDKMK